MQHNLNHHKVVDYFGHPLDFIGDVLVHMQPSLGLQVDLNRPSGEPRVGLRLSQGFLRRAIQR